jgi:hypothetical protein
LDLELEDQSKPCALRSRGEVRSRCAACAARSFGDFFRLLCIFVLTMGTACAIVCV